MVSASWIHSLHKEELIACLTKLSQDTSGSVDDLRKRLKAFMLNEENQEKFQAQFADFKAEFAPATSTNSKTQAGAQIPPPEGIENHEQIKSNPQVQATATTTASTNLQ